MPYRHHTLLKTYCLYLRKANTEDKNWSKIITDTKATWTFRNFKRNIKKLKEAENFNKHFQHFGVNFQSCTVVILAMFETPNTDYAAWIICFYYHIFCISILLANDKVSKNYVQVLNIWQYTIFWPLHFVSPAFFRCYFRNWLNLNYSNCAT